MDCNRDEAARSRDIAEKKFMQHDFLGARKFALKAKQLFPDLEGLVQFIAVVDVHVTAQERLQGGERNWYSILQSDPSADDAFLRKQYRKLALVLHPDKNKAVGAEAAFKFISEAWTILSDTTKKATYDKLMKPSAPKPASAPASAKKPWPASQSKQTAKPSSNAPKARPPHHASSPAATTFWTACPVCKLQFEYHIMYKTKNLCCPFCLKPFLARELSVLINGLVLWPLPHEHNRTNADARGTPIYVNGNSNVTNFGMRKDNLFSHSEKSQFNPEVRKENIILEKPSVCKEQIRKGGMDHLKTNWKPDDDAFDPSVVKPCVVDQKSYNSSHAFDPSVVKPCADMEVQLDASPLKKVKVDVQCMMKEQPMDGNSKTNLFETGSDLKNADLYGFSGFKVKTSQSNGDPVSHVSVSASKVKMNCDVRDSDFTTFDNDRTDKQLSAGQLWACYDDDDGFPRFYAQVVKVISQEPFKIQYTWLEACSPSVEVISWMNSGFSCTCGEFQLGKTLVGDSLCRFSHVMAFEKGEKTSFKIYPRKGEVWALYKNWASLKRKIENRGYDLVEVLTDYSDELGVQACALVKVEGFKLVFKQQSAIMYWVLPQHMRGFSHNIPVHQLVGGEIPECIKGCLELDPASTPPM